MKFLEGLQHQTNKQAYQVFTCAATSDVTHHHMNLHETCYSHHHHLRSTHHQKRIMAHLSVWCGRLLSFQHFHEKEELSL